MAVPGLDGTVAVVVVCESSVLVLVVGWVSDMAYFELLPVVGVVDGLSAAGAESQLVDPGEVVAVDDFVAVAVLAVLAHVTADGLLRAGPVVQAGFEIVGTSLVTGSSTIVPVSPRNDVRAAEVASAARIVAFDRFVAVAAGLA